MQQAKQQQAKDRLTDALSGLISDLKDSGNLQPISGNGQHYIRYIALNSLYIKLTNKLPKISLTDAEADEILSAKDEQSLLLQLAASNSLTNRVIDKAMGYQQGVLFTIPLLETMQANGLKITDGAIALSDQKICENKQKNNITNNIDNIKKSTTMQPQDAKDKLYSLLYAASKKDLKDTHFFGANYFHLSAAIDKLQLSDEECTIIANCKDAASLKKAANNAADPLGQLIKKMSEFALSDSFIVSLADTQANSIPTKKPDEEPKIDTNKTPTTEEWQKSNDNIDYEDVPQAFYKYCLGATLEQLCNEYMDYKKDVSKAQFLSKNAPKLFALKWAEQYGKVYGKTGTEAEQENAVKLYLNSRTYTQLMAEGVPDWMIKKYKKLVETIVNQKYKAEHPTPTK